MTDKERHKELVRLMHDRTIAMQMADCAQAYGDNKTWLNAQLSVKDLDQQIQQLMNSKTTNTKQQ